MRNENTEKIVQTRVPGTDLRRSRRLTKHNPIIRLNNPISFNYYRKHREQVELGPSHERLNATGRGTQTINQSDNLQTREHRQQEMAASVRPRNKDMTRIFGRKAIEMKSGDRTNQAEELRLDDIHPIERGGNVEV